MRSGFGAAPADLENILAIFQADLGGVDHGDSPDPHTTGYRSIAWDDVPDSSAAPALLPADLYNSVFPRGAVLSTPGTGFQVSGTVESGVAVNFGNLDSSYIATFQPFSAQRLFTPLGDPVTEVAFFMPGDPGQPAYVHGFGAVFCDVDQVGETSIELLDPDGQSLFTGYAPVSPDGGLSFLGVSFNAGEQVGRVRLTSGNRAPGPGVLDGSAVDVVVMDNVYFGEPKAVPEPGVLALGAVGLGVLLAAGVRRRRRN